MYSLIHILLVLYTANDVFSKKRKFVLAQEIKIYRSRGVDVKLSSSVTLLLVVVVTFTHRPFISRIKNCSTHRTESWVDPRDDNDIWRRRVALVPDVESTHGS